jgi:hypothetical protein
VKALTFIVVSLFVIVSVRAADFGDDARRAMARGFASVSEEISRHSTNDDTIVESLIRNYDAQHPKDLWLNVLSTKDLKKLARERTNDLAPRLLLLMQDLKNDHDCEEWFVTLKESFALCTNEAHRAACLSLAFPASFTISTKEFGKPMLRKMETWIGEISAENPIFAERTRYIRLATALGLGEDSNVSLYIKDTPIRFLEVLYLMTKAKWETALAKAQELKAQRNLDNNEKAILDELDLILTGIVSDRKKKAAK